MQEFNSIFELEEIKPDNNDWRYECKNIIEKVDKNLKQKNYLSYDIIKKIGNIQVGNLFLVSCVTNLFGQKDLFILEKIEIKSLKQENELQEQIKKIQMINSEYIMNINASFISEEENKKIMNILINYYKYNNLEEIVYKLNFLNSKIIWKIFIQIIQGLKALNSKNIILDKLFLNNIYLDKEKNVKIGGYSDILNFNLNINYYSDFYYPEILEFNNNKFNIWCLGCILYEMVFQKKFNEIEDNHSISLISQKSSDYDSEFKQILSKLLSKGKKD